MIESLLQTFLVKWLKWHWIEPPTRVFNDNNWCASLRRGEAKRVMVWLVCDTARAQLVCDIARAQLVCEASDVKTATRGRWRCNYCARLALGNAETSSRLHGVSDGATQQWLRGFFVSLWEKERRLRREDMWEKGRKWQRVCNSQIVKIILG